uniref:Peptidase C19 ubiquitin carboxyl-terminal hydrolase domain-containing protein n=1 Tax=Chromera velia CCMP2878 TaxID=1169474 RepID=A0A0G4HXV6_9ALVE|eukprot:Cvel_9352.t1-p1 / transcript=Cvel_9352.t1 / gene=Cvel_9352 / organism=Chromera_velia_CCMP2878 / gene_product=hypothetical protein / transcript_product=hypothetical protein / location=Cvel_scaffold537:15958-16578(+) / protein_length=207 / sequence_SO=supercontig / SO=protein_coding / is_pseudo=false
MKSSFCIHGLGSDVRPGKLLGGGKDDSERPRREAADRAIALNLQISLDAEMTQEMQVGENKKSMNQPQHPGSQASKSVHFSELIDKHFKDGVDKGIECKCEKCRKKGDRLMKWTILDLPRYFVFSIARFHEWRKTRGSKNNTKVTVPIWLDFAPYVYRSVNKEGAAVVEDAVEVVEGEGAVAEDTVEVVKGGDALVKGWREPTITTA